MAIEDDLTEVVAYIRGQQLLSNPAELHRRITNLEEAMSKSTEALAALDAQIDDLVAYVNSDDATDAAEVQARADRIKAALADARSGDVTPEPPLPVDGGDTPAA